MGNTKICTGCEIDKPFNNYTKAKLGKFGLRSKCKDCRAKEAIEFNSTRKEAISLHGKRYRKEKAEQISAQRAIHTAQNKERLAEYGHSYRQTNPGKVNANTAKRRAQKRKATPPWLTEEHWRQIETFYVEAARLTKETGIPHEVDHEIPLRGKTVSGLHVPNNLRVITRPENRKKSYKLIV